MTNVLKQRWAQYAVFAALFAFMGFFALPQLAHAADGDVFDGAAYLYDLDEDGYIETVVFDIVNDSTDTWSLAGAAPYGLSVTMGGQPVTISGVTISSDADANPVSIQISLDTTDSDLVLSTDGVNANAIELVYTQETGDNTCSTACIKDDNNNELAAIATGDGTVTEADFAEPVLVSVSPANGAAAVGRTQPLVLTFSEAMETDFDLDNEYTFSSSITFTDTWSSGDTVVTLSHTQSFNSSTLYTLTVDPTGIDAVGGDDPALVQPDITDFTFYTTSSSESSSGSGSGGSSSTPLTYSVAVTSPNVADLSYVPGTVLPITWSTGGTGSISFVDIYASYDGGLTYTQIANDTNNDGSYNWTLPDVSTSNAIVKVVGTDLALDLASDVSDYAFTIRGSATAQPGDTSSDDMMDVGEALDLPTTGTSPTTGQMESVDMVRVGDLIRGTSYDAVYYIDMNGTRRPFMNSQTFFTYYSNFNSVKTVTNATLSVVPLGAPMLPKAGVVLIKLQSDPKVYAVEMHPTDMTKAVKRHVPSEQVATTLYGANWADYVIDVDATLYARFDEGNPMAADESVDRAQMKRRVDLR